MTDAEKVRTLKVLIDFEEKDEVLTVYLNIAKSAIMERLYPCKTDLEGLEFPSKYDMLQIQIAQFLVNKQGAEGQVTHT